MAVGPINTAKELEEGYQPLLLVFITFVDGTVLRLCTHGLDTPYGGFKYGGNAYLPFVMEQDIAAVQAMSEQGIDQPPAMTLTLMDPDAFLWGNYELPIGFKGAEVDLTLILWNVGHNDFSSDSVAGKFTGICNTPGRNQDTIRVLVTNKLNMSQQYLPTTHIQPLCPNIFPATMAQRIDGADNSDSPFFGCGYAPDATSSNARGNYESGSTPFTTCTYTRAACIVRGMYIKDNHVPPRNTGRFRGVTWVPPESWKSRGYTDPKAIQGFNSPNEAKYNDMVPLVYGTTFVDGVVLNVVGDANLTRMEILVCEGDVGPGGIHNVIVNDIQVPDATYGISPEYVKVGLYWNFVNEGSREGGPNPTKLYDSLGDPYGGLCVLIVTVPRSLVNSTSVPRVRILVRGQKIPVYSPFITNVTTDGTNTTITYSRAHPFQVGEQITTTGVTGSTYANVFIGIISSTSTTVTVGPLTGAGTYAGGGYSYKKDYSTNLIYNAMAMLIKLGHREVGLDMDLCAAAATVSGTYIDQNSIFGGTRSAQRYSIGYVIRQRLSGSDVLRRIRLAGKLLLVPNSTNGLLGISVKQTLADSQPAAISGSNYNVALVSPSADGTPSLGYVAYKFDASTISRKSKNGPMNLEVIPVSNQDSLNSVGFTFQDEENGYVLDSIQVNDSEDIARVGGLVQGGIPVDGVVSFDQARRILNTSLAETYRGNPRNYDTGGDTGGTLALSIISSQRASHLKIGQIVLVDPPQWGVTDLLQDEDANPVDGFLAMVIAIKPATNFETAQVMVKFHNDIWYTDAWGQMEVPSASANHRKRLSRPPFGWMPSATVPVVDDVLYDQTQLSFDLVQGYENTPDGSATTFLSLSGVLPISSFSTTKPPYMPLQATTSSTGGSLLGGKNYYVSICALGTDGLVSTPSVVTSAVFVPAGTDTNTITVSNINYDPTAAAFVLFAGTDPNQLGRIGDSLIHPGVTTSGGLKPSSITIESLEGVISLRQGLPDVEFDHLEMAVKAVSHSGVAGMAVTSIMSSTSITVDQGGFDTDQFAGYVMSLLGKKLLDTINIANWSVTSNNSDGTFVISGPDASIILEEGDVVVIRSRSATITDTTITDPNWVNAQYMAGLVIDNEVGNLVRFLAGTAAGTTARILSNGTSSISVDSWPITPDATSVFIIEEPSWESYTFTQPVVETGFEDRTSTTVATNNLAKQTVLVAAWTCDEDGRTSFDAHTPMRDVYLYPIGYGGDTGLPSTFGAFSIVCIGDGQIILQDVTLTGTDNLQSVLKLRLKAGFVDERNIFATTITLDAGGSSLTVVSSSGFAVGDLVWAEAEIMEITSISTLTWGVLRGQKGTSVTAHGAVSIIRTQTTNLDTNYAPGQFAASVVSSVVKVNTAFPFQCARIGWWELSLINAIGQGVALVTPESAIQNDGPSAKFPSGLQGAAYGLRTLYGVTLVLQTWVQDVLVVANDVFTHDHAPVSAMPWQVFAEVYGQASSGASIVVRVNKNGSSWVTLTIAAGAVLSQGVSGASLSQVQGGDVFTADVTGIGSSFPGRGVRIKVQF